MLENDQLKIRLFLVNLTPDVEVINLNLNIVYKDYICQLETTVHE